MMPASLYRSALSAVAVLMLAACAVRATGPQAEQPPDQQQDAQRAAAQLVREMQMDLEGGSSSGLLRKIDSAKFDDYSRFQDMVERLLREDALRVFFRQVSSEAQEGRAQTVLDAEMELTRKDSPTAPERRRQQLTIDLERTSRGWRIVNITPRDFFRPL